MDLQEIINQDSVTIVDVRERIETFFGIAPNAKKIPLGRVKGSVEEFQKMSKPIVVYCRSGNRSEAVVGYLQSQGITEIYNGGSLGNVRSLLKGKNK